MKKQKPKSSTFTHDRQTIACMRVDRRRNCDVGSCFTYYLTNCVLGMQIGIDDRLYARQHFATQSRIIFILHDEFNSHLIFYLVSYVWFQRKTISYCLSVVVSFSFLFYFFIHSLNLFLLLYVYFYFYFYFSFLGIFCLSLSLSLLFLPTSILLY